MALLFSCTSVPQPKPPTLAPRTDAVPVLAARQGADFLVARQNADGSWGTFATHREREVLVTGPATFKAFSVATTALCARALLEPSREDAKALAAVRRGVEYMLKTPVADRGHPEVFCEVWVHTYRAEMMAQVLADRRFKDLWPAARNRMQADVDSLCRLQAAEGGYAYYDFEHTLVMPTGKCSTSFNTACALRALVAAKAAGAVVPAGVIEQARRALVSMRSPEGTFLYSFPFRRAPQAGVNRPQGAGGRTSVGLLALADTGEDPDVSRRDIRENLRRFRDNYNFLIAAYARPVPHEAYYANAGYFVTFGLFYAAEAAESLKDDDGRKFAAWEAAEVAALQSDVGSWMDFPLYGYGQYYSTAYALLALQANARTLAGK